MSKLTEKQAFILRAMRINGFELHANSADRMYFAGAFLSKGRSVTLGASEAEEVSRAVCNRLEALGYIRRVEHSWKELRNAPPGFVEWELTDEGRAVR